jgi:preprotein translocase subunit SecF
MRFLTDTKFDFMKRRRAAFLFSLAIIVPGLISILVRGGLNLGVEFTGGVQVETRISGETMSIERVREAVAAAGFDNRNIQRAGGRASNDFLIHLQTTQAGESVSGESGGGEGQHVSEKIVASMQQMFPDRTITLRGVQAVGPNIGAELRLAAIQAIVLAILLVMAYVAWRFEFRFGVATILAALHDLLFVLGLFSILNKEMTLTTIAAFLTLIGYSVNDTIVVFDRIREELKLRQKRDSYETIFNDAINKTLGRTLLTGVTTLLVLIALYGWGGDVIRDFAWVLLVGIVVGTYSSIFVAAPMVIEWQKRADARDAAKAQRAA